MKEPEITAHCLVRNEEKWVWYAINSILNYVDKVLVYDTGSTDKTVEIIKSIKNPKIHFEQKGVVDKQKFANLRQEMLDKTTSEWFMVLDGDEIWPKKTIQELKVAIQKATPEKDAIVVSQITCIGDIYHYSKELSEMRQTQYKNKIGFRLPRAIRNIKGLHTIGIYGIESYADKENLNISFWEETRLVHIKNKYFHMSFLPRSSNVSKDREVMMRSFKTFYHTGASIPENIQYPEVLYMQRPEIVPSPWERLTTIGKIKGLYFRGLNLKERIQNKIKNT